MGCANCLTHRYHFLGAGRAEPKRTQYNIICDILFVISHEARPSSVPPKLELWGGTVNTAVPPVKTLEGTVPPCPPHDLRHCTLGPTVRLSQLLIVCITHRLYMCELRTLWAKLQQRLVCESYWGI